MDKSKSHSLPFLAVIGMFLVLLVVYFALLQPSFNQLSEKKDEVAGLRDQAHLIERALGNKIEKGLLSDELQAALPLWDNSEQLVVSMKEIAQSSQTKLSSMSFSISDSNQIQALVGGTEPLYPDVKEIKAQVIVQGSYDQIRSWLVQVQNLPRLIVIDSVRYSMAVSGTVAAEISFTGYFDSSYAYLLENPVFPTAAEQ
ncbi:hypothetical protein [Paenibacillus sp. sgz302251]|uniref:hypothetical protein n=1 Tax=Paenibacillus sp. sgz302251 TaxID=3414493 RepID=UPI003C7B0F9B